MKTLVFSTLVAAFTISTSAGAQTLSPADRYDIRIAAEWAARDAMMKTGEPVAVQGGYVVPVNVGNTKCTVTVRPYTPKSDFASNLRWKADAAKCDK